MPPLDPELYEVLIIFWELDTCRAVGFGAGPIPWTAMVIHQQVHGYDQEVFDFLWELIRAMDGAYLKHLSEKKGGEGG
jgi:hypothetical protein